MNKISINVLCALILAAVLCSVAGPVMQFGRGVGMGVSASMDDNIRRSSVLDNTMVEVDFSPSVEEIVGPGEYLVTAQGDSIPMIYGKNALLVPPERVWSQTETLTIVTWVLIVVLAVLMLIQFIKFILNINRNKIFVQSNVRHLRLFGFFLMGAALVEIISGFVYEMAFDQAQIVVPNYELAASWLFPWTDIILSLVALLIAQVWQRAIILREEQELTV